MATDALRLLRKATRKGAVVSADTEALLATVRAGIRMHPDEPTDVMVDLERNALAALDSLTAELERVQKENADLRQLASPTAMAVIAEKVDAEIQLERVKAERDAQQRRIEDLEEGAWPWEWVIATRERERWKVAEARLDKALTALREIRDWADSVEAEDCPGLRGIARRCLAEIEGEA